MPNGYLLKDLPAPDLASAVQAVFKGIYQLDPAVASKVIASLSRSQTFDSATQSLSVSSSSTLSNAGTPSPRPVDLTRREVEVLRLIAVGATNHEIAEQLVISEGSSSSTQQFAIADYESAFVTLFVTIPRRAPIKIRVYKAWA